MTQQPITIPAKSNHGACDLAHPHSLGQLAAHRQGRLHDVVALALPEQSEAGFLCSGEPISVMTGTRAPGEVIQGASPGTMTIVIVQGCVQLLMERLTEARECTLLAPAERDPPWNSRVVRSEPGLPCAS